MTDTGMTTRTPEDILAEALHEQTLHNERGGVDDDLAKTACVQFGWGESRCMRRGDVLVAALASQGYSIVQEAELERLRAVKTAAQGHVDWEYRRRGAPRVTLTGLRAALSPRGATSER